MAIVLATKKNKIFLIVVLYSIIAVAFSVYNDDFIHLFFNPFLIMLEYVSTFKSQKEKDFSNDFYFGANLSVILGGFSLIFHFVNTDHFSELKYQYSLFAILMLFAFFVAIAIESAVSKSIKTSKKDVLLSRRQKIEVYLFC